VLKRKHKEIRKLILENLKDKILSINEISTSIKSKWNVANNHLIWLKGKEFVKETMTHRRLRLFEITKKGKEYLKKMKNV